MCGIAAVIGGSINILYDSLFNLQHRGQQASGVVSFCSKTKKTFKSKKIGLVDKQIAPLLDFRGNMGIGHVRYPTTGKNTRREIQPFTITKPFGISLSHNGNLTNSEELKIYLEARHIFMNSTSDSEIILNLFYLWCEKEFSRLTHDSIYHVINKIIDICQGSFSVLIMIHDYGLVAFRDKRGIRPLCYYQDEYKYVFASETVALPHNQNKYKNVGAGEVVIVGKNMDVLIRGREINAQLSPCLFEYIYFARQESYINDVLVYDFREKIGDVMIESIDPSIVEAIDIVVPVPMTSLISATRIAYLLKKPMKHAVLKNRYTHRTFINQGDEITKNIKKIQIVSSLVKGKTILLVDDSIVRGNTSKHIISELRAAGVGDIYFACCSPPIRFPNIYGISIPTTKELVAHNRTEEEVRKYLDVDGLYYLSYDKMVSVLQYLNPKLKNFESSVFFELNS